MTEETEVHCDRKRFLTMLGFARRAGKVTVGCDLIFAQARKGKRSFLILIGADVSERGKERIRHKAEFYHIPYLVTDMTKAELSHQVGHSGSLSALAITDRVFSEELIKSSGKDFSPLGD